MAHILIYGVNKRLHTRQRMRSSNRKAVLWLLKNGYDDIWLKPHGRRHDLVYNTGEWYRALDLWNLFDGICSSVRSVDNHISIHKSDHVFKCF